MYMRVISATLSFLLDGSFFLAEEVYTPPITFSHDLLNNHMSWKLNLISFWYFLITYMYIYVYESNFRHLEFFTRRFLFFAEEIVSVWFSSE